MAERIKPGDHVLHRPTGETWLVAFADYDTNDLAWCGWPPGMARISDCDLVEMATEEESQELLGRLLAMRDDFRSAACRRLYAKDF